jgi:hypothetical protein
LDGLGESAFVDLVPASATAAWLQKGLLKNGFHIERSRRRITLLVMRQPRMVHLRQSLQVNRSLGLVKSQDMLEGDGEGVTSVSWMLWPSGLRTKVFSRWTLPSSL